MQNVLRSTVVLSTIYNIFRSSVALSTTSCILIDRFSSLLSRVALVIYTSLDLDTEILRRSLEGATRGGSWQGVHALRNECRQPDPEG